MVSSDTAVTNDTLYVVLGSVLGGLTVLVVLLVALYHCRQRSAERGTQTCSIHFRTTVVTLIQCFYFLFPFKMKSIEHDRSVWNGKPMTNENGNTISVSPNHHYAHHHHHNHKMHGGFVDRPIYAADGQHADNDETAETSFCQRTQHRSSGDLLRSTDSLSRSSLKRGGYVRNGSTPSLHQHPPNRKVVDSNTLPLLMHHNNGRRDACMDDAEWEASVPPADSEKFI